MTTSREITPCLGKGVAWTGQNLRQCDLARWSYTNGAARRCTAALALE